MTDLDLDAEQLDDWWEWNCAHEWETQLRHYGYVELPRHIEVPLPDYRMAVLAEMRWGGRTGLHWDQSRLWDPPGRVRYLSFMATKVGMA